MLKYLTSLILIIIVAGKASAAVQYEAKSVPESVKKFIRYKSKNAPSFIHE